MNEFFLLFPLRETAGFTCEIRVRVESCIRIGVCVFASGFTYNFKSFPWSLSRCFSLGSSRLLCRSRSREGRFLISIVSALSCTLFFCGVPCNVSIVGSMKQIVLAPDAVAHSSKQVIRKLFIATGASNSIFSDLAKSDDPDCYYETRRNQVNPPAKPSSTPGQVGNKRASQSREPNVYQQLKERNAGAGIVEDKAITSAYVVPVLIHRRWHKDHR
jgi:hypothetical protein